MLPSMDSYPDNWTITEVVSLTAAKEIVTSSLPFSAMALSHCLLALALCLSRHWHYFHIGKPLVSGRILLAIFFCDFLSPLSRSLRLCCFLNGLMSLLVGCACLREGFRILKSQVMLSFVVCCSNFPRATDKLPGFTCFSQYLKTATLMSVHILYKHIRSCSTLWWQTLQIFWLPEAWI